MSTSANSSASPEYLLLIRGTNWDKGLAPGEIQEIMGRFISWMDGISKDGKLKGAQPLESSGVLIGKGGRVVADGPFAESKEAIGGYFLLTVPTFEDAVAIAQACPMINHGCQMEVRPVADMCPHMKLAQEQEAAALAGV